MRWEVKCLILLPRSVTNMLVLACEHVSTLEGPRSAFSVLFVWGVVCCWGFFFLRRWFWRRNFRFSKKISLADGIRDSKCPDVRNAPRDAVVPSVSLVVNAAQTEAWTEDTAWSVSVVQIWPITCQSAPTVEERTQMPGNWGGCREKKEMRKSDRNPLVRCLLLMAFIHFSCWLPFFLLLMASPFVSVFVFYDFSLYLDGLPYIWHKFCYISDVFSDPFFFHPPPPFISSQIPHLSSPSGSEFMYS